MQDLQILIVEDDRLLRKAMYDRLSGDGHNVQACETLAEAGDHMDRQSFDLAFVDMRLPDGDGLDFISRNKESTSATEMVVMTAFADVSTAVDAIKRGAYDYLPKPFEDEQLEKIVRNVSDKAQLSRQVSTLSRMTVGDFDDVWRFDSMIGTSVLSRIFETAKRIAESPDTTVLILGESGTGKGMLAKAIHRASPRSAQPFVDINSSAIPGQLMESELFGYEKGAFTDAKNRKQGLLEVAHGGTVFLDEIGDMDLNLQGKLLKVIEDKEFRRLGGAATTRVDIRVVAATHRDLRAWVKDGRFREDLYYRLSVVPIVMPPLREHRESIEPLAHFFLNLFCRQMGRTISGFTPSAWSVLKGYAWPGNVREMRNVIERSVILAHTDVVDVDVLGLPQGDALLSDAQGDGVQPMSLAECEKRLIQSVLESVEGNRSKAAGVLKIHRTTLYKKIEEYGLDG